MLHLLILEFFCDAKVITVFQPVPNPFWLSTANYAAKRRKDPDEVKQQIANPKALKMRWKLANTVTKKKAGNRLGGLRCIANGNS